MEDSVHACLPIAGRESEQAHLPDPDFEHAHTKSPLGACTPGMEHLLSVVRIRLVNIGQCRSAVASPHGGAAAITNPRKFHTLKRPAAIS
jgi:hypothetical protein